MFVQSNLLFKWLKSSVHESRVDASAHRILLEFLLTALAPALAAVVCKCGYKFYIHVVLQHNYRKKMMYWLWLAVEGQLLLGNLWEHLFSCHGLCLGRNGDGGLLVILGSRGL